MVLEESMLCFDSNLAKSKPESIVKRDTSCPFCETESLTNVIDREGTIIWVENKYPTLQDTYQTIIIETDQCESELSEYDPSHLKQLFRFAFEKWLVMENSGEYKSVILYKNHGLLSGGTIRHPHMQIVGLKKLNYWRKVNTDTFDGEFIHSAGNVSLSVSNYPLVGFTEFNVKVNENFNLKDVDQMAVYIQNGTHFLLNHLKCNSYNLFFYRLNQLIFVKIMPRFVTSPLFLGYSIPQVSNNINEIVTKMKDIYFK
ncbi:DUF4931 domain-containing protein [Chengkuizengella axinellae]|uniref:DUF4931 domain-containing protein n=1 Tax=Chengkuizengella axinellae TaxID=3064388 RepID=A0ABT9IX87_9BACL|nr:DUF4931 domain-containing protein [Chengkuizengella sp. 2205SS18-9]MDP5273927.1 DUF4931 domain-containing protein [Chengkuizengella sp. 2205SS18-9]